MPAATAPVRNCINCGLRLVQPAVGRKRVYCSTLCRVGRWYQAHRQAAHLHDWVEDEERICHARCVSSSQELHQLRVAAGTACRGTEAGLLFDPLPGGPLVSGAPATCAHLHHDWVEDGDDVICLTCGKTWQLVNGAGSYGEADDRR